MQYEQDYIMRMIRQVIHALIGVLLNKKTTPEYEIPANRQQNTDDNLFQRLAVLADQGKICAAENILLEALDSGSDEAFMTGLQFYDHVNDYDDDFMEVNNFSREEIRQGILGLAEQMGKYAMAAPLLGDL
jgi:hypothetical protein